MNRTATSRRRNLGFTLVELCVCVGIGAALLSQAIPSLGKMRQERTLRATSEALASDLRFARSEAARLGESVHFRISRKGAESCYVLHTGAANDCDCAGGQAVCKVPSSNIIKAEWLPAGKQMRLRSNAETLQFQHRQGLVTQTGSIELNLDSGAGIRQVVAITGRVRNCSTGVKLSGMSKCA
ncbi:GspH/FimT family pseudopilin [Roseateles sp. BYS78W]|uniref:Type II secretion system protein H n=1 Tax=Pelomonas candidula TaxID=3299025 RepID=A0ABW7HD61_9BURK